MKTIHMNNEKKHYFIYGSDEHPERVTAALEEKGGINEYCYLGNIDCRIYFIDKKNHIRWAEVDSPIYDILVDVGERLYPKPDYKYNIGDKVRYNGEAKVIIDRKGDKGMPMYRFLAGDEYISEELLDSYEPQFEPYQRVLCRDRAELPWRADLYSHKNTDSGSMFLHVCAGGFYVQCIPYEGNEHLIGTTGTPNN